MHARVAAILTSVALVFVVAACGSGATATGSPAAAGGTLEIRDAWVRAAQAGGTSAAYMTLANGRGAPETLHAVSASALTDSASLHETSSDSSGMTGMSHVDSIVIPAGGTVLLEPGGYHVMLMDLKQELKAGDRVTLSLTFDATGAVEVSAEVRAD